MNGSRILWWPSKTIRQQRLRDKPTRTGISCCSDPVVTSVPKGSVVMPLLVGLLSPHSPEKSCRTSPGCRRRPLRHRSEEHTSELQSRGHLVCRLLLEKKKI